MSGEYKCPQCGKPCEAKECDDGLGPVEFWGAKSYDSHPYMGSDCCEAQLDDVDFPDIDDRADYEYERMKDEKLCRDQ